MMSLILYPLIAAAMARAMPVLPEVASIRVSPGLIIPFLSASTIMLIAGLPHKYPCEYCYVLIPSKSVD